MPTIIDTNVLIDHLRGHEGATLAIIALIGDGPAFCSRLTRVELAAGLRSHQLDGHAALDQCSTQGQGHRSDTIEVDEEIGARAVELAATWGPSHGGIDVTDYVIAATAEQRNLDLLTTNVKHFPMFEGLAAPY